MLLNGYGNFRKLIFFFCQRQHEKKSIYNLNEDEELTHYGQSLADIEKHNDIVDSDSDTEERGTLSGTGWEQGDSLLVLSSVPFSLYGSLFEGFFVCACLPVKWGHFDGPDSL